MAGSRPRIAVTLPRRGGEVFGFLLGLAVFIGGGRAVKIRPDDAYDVRKLHGLILSGGSDVSPSLYGQEKREGVVSKRKKSRLGLFSVFFSLIIWLLRLFLRQKTVSGQLDSSRDMMELEVLAAMLGKKKPVLGICRGAQLLNVFFGGTLHQDLMHFYTEIPQLRTILPQKKITVFPDSRLYGIVKISRLAVNALHNQAVHQTGEILQVCAVEETGVIQAVEGKQGFLLGVQWHPEFLLHMPAQRNLFRALVQEASGFADEE